MSDPGSGGRHDTIKQAPVRSQRAGPLQNPEQIGRLLHAHYSSMAEESVPSELRSFVVSSWRSKRANIIRRRDNRGLALAAARSDEIQRMG